MMLTEEEAKQKACCGPIGVLNAVLIGAASVSGASFTLAPGVSDAGSCLASACMAWRWGFWNDTRDRDLFSKEAGRRVNSTTSDDADWRLANPNETPPPRRGYCGLAGRPA